MQSRLYAESILSAMKHFDERNLQAVYWDWFVRSSREYHRMDVKRSKALLEGYPCRPKECFANALLIAMSEPELVYVEGFAMAVIPVEHAWVVDRDGTVLDPTWAMLPYTYEPDYFGVEIPLIVAAKHYASRTLTPAWAAYAEQQLKQTFVSGKPAGQTNVA